MATIPSPKRTAARLPARGRAPDHFGADREEGQRERRRLEAGTALEQKSDSRGRPPLIENGLGRPREADSIVKVRLQGFAAHLDTRGVRSCNRFLTSSNKESSMTVLCCVCF